MRTNAPTLRPRRIGIPSLCALRAPRRGPALLVAALSLAACGGASDGGQDADSPEATPAAVGGELERIDSCSLLTVAEAESALGGAVGEPMKQEADAYDPRGRAYAGTCIYGAGTLGGIVVMVRQDPGTARRSAAEWAAETTADLDEQRADPDLADGLPTGGAQVVEIPGHTAIAVDWGDFVIVSVRKGGVVGTEISISAPDLATARTLATTAISRVP